MMKIQHLVGTMVLALVGVGQSVYGEQPVEIFAKLAEPSVAVQRNVEARAKAIPALSGLPSVAEGVLAVKVPEGLCPEIYCIGSAAVCAGKDGARASESVLDILDAFSSVVQVVEFNEEEDADAQRNKTEKERIGEELVARFTQEKLEVLYQKLEKGSVPVLYAVFTAKPGKEKEFAEWANATSSRMFQKLPDGSQKVSEQGFTGIKISMIDLAEHLLQGLKKGWHVQPDDARIHKALENRFVYLLAKQDAGVTRFVVCENPEQIHTPSSLEDSLAASPALDGMDAHIDSMIATACIPKDLMNYMGSKERATGRLPWIDLLRSAFHEMSQHFPQEAKQFTAAADGVDEVQRQLSAHGTQLTSDCTLQVWGEDNDVLVELAGDASAAAYEPGELKHLDLATEPGNLFYAETTPAPAPFPLLNLQKLTGAVIDIVSGVSLALDEEEKDNMAGLLMFLQQGRMMIEGAAAGLDKIFAELSCPLTLVVTDNVSESQDERQPQFAVKGGVQIAVRNQSGLDEGWNQFCTSMSPLIGSPILSFLPFQAATLPDGATSYTLQLPPELLRGLTPQIIRNNSAIVFASDADTARRLHEPSATKFPLCGAAFSLDTKLFGKVGCCPGAASPVKVDHVYGVSSQRGNHFVLKLRLVTIPTPSN